MMTAETAPFRPLAAVAGFFFIRRRRDPRLAASAGPVPYRPL
jgi:hypothetical protein